MKRWERKFRCSFLHKSIMRDTFCASPSTDFRSSEDSLRALDGGLGAGANGLAANGLLLSDAGTNFFAFGLIWTGGGPPLVAASASTLACAIASSKSPMDSIA